MATGAVLVPLSCEGLSRSVMVYQGMRTEEIRTVIGATFSIDEEVIGIKDEESGVHFPLSLLRRVPDEFASKIPYSLVVNNINTSNITEKSTPSIIEKEAIIFSCEISADDVDILIHYLRQSSPNGMLDHETLIRCTQTLLSQKPNDKKLQLIQKDIEKLFKFFLHEGNEFIDLREFLVGLAILTKTNRIDLMETIFSLYGIEKVGLINFDEMQKYLLCFFTVVAEISPEQFSQNNTSPKELSFATTKKCFQEVDFNHTERLNFEQFQVWFSSSIPNQITQTTTTECKEPTNLRRDAKNVTNTSSNNSNQKRRTLPSLDSIRITTGLGDKSPTEVFTQFRKLVPQGDVTRSSFQRVFLQLLPEQAVRTQGYDNIENILDQLFDIFDVDNNGMVDASELASGLSLLCGGTCDEKVSAAFSVFDLDHDGYITLEEMTIYLTSVYRVLYSTDPAIERRMGVNAEELAKITAEQCFEEADQNQDRKLTFEEFKKWYSSSFAFPESQEQTYEKISPSQGMNTSGSIREISYLIGLQQVGLMDLILFFRFINGNRPVIDKQTFLHCFRNLTNRLHLSPEQIKRSQEIVEKLFSLFHPNQNGDINLSELMSGLSVLCGGSCNDKVRASFWLYDLNNDGFISREEMISFLKSVYRVVFSFQPDMATRTGIPPEELAKITAARAFEVADENNDGMISFEEFGKWYNDSEAPSEEPQTSINTIIESIQKLANLSAFTSSQLSNFFCEQIDDSGTMKKERFLHCFFVLIKSNPANNLSEINMDLVQKHLEKLFESFDKDHDNLINLDELHAGLSLLNVSDRDEQVQKAFKIFDVDGDGFVSLKEMISYLTNMFATMQANSPNNSNERVTPEELAEATARQCFLDVDINDDGKLSFDEFKAWYTQGAVDPQWLTASTQNTQVTMADIQISTYLNSFPLQTVFNLFAENADKEGILNHAAFSQCFHSLIKNSPSITSPNTDLKHLNLIIDHLFNIFDVENNRMISFDVLASGLSLLCAGTKEEKIHAVFNLFDVDGDDCITQNELEIYLFSVFNLFFKLCPDILGVQHRNISSRELAQSTIKQIFAEIDQDEFGQIVFENFILWLKDSKCLGNQIFNLCFERSSQSIASNALAQNKQEQIQDAKFNPFSSLKEAQSSQQNQNYFSIQEIQHFTRLQSKHVDEIFELIARVADSKGMITRPAFTKCLFHQIVVPNFGNNLSSEQYDSSLAVINFLFDTFDVDRNELVDLIELSSGLSVLCGGTKTDKVKAAFSLYDIDHDGFITFNEMTTYLASVYRLMFKLSPGSQVPPETSAEELAHVTALQAFAEADTNHDGKICFEEFNRWYNQMEGSSSPKGNNIPTNQSTNDQQKNLIANPLRDSKGNIQSVIVDQVPELSSLTEARQMTNLGAHEISDMIQVFAIAANERGEIDRRTFHRCMNRFVKDQDRNPSEKEQLNNLLDRLFDAFDKNKNQFVDTSELLSGLSILCGGNRDDKVRATFQLFDSNNDGFITLEEITTFLISVFRVLFETQPELPRKVQTTPEELGKLTAEQALEMTDIKKNGKISFAEFKKWYTSNEASFLLPEAVSREISLQTIRRVTTLNMCNVWKTFKHFYGYVNPSGVITRAKFFKGFQDLIALHNLNSQDQKLVDIILIKLFEIFDPNTTGVVEFNALASGLSVLSAGTRNEKIQAAFSVFDTRRDGYILLQDMTTFLTAVFRLLFETNPDDKAEIGISAQQLAITTAKQAFEEANLDLDGRISFAGFSRWYLQGGYSDVGFNDPVSNDSHQKINNNNNNNNNANINNNNNTKLNNLVKQKNEKKMILPEDDLEDARKIFQLGCFTINDILETLAEAAPTSSISKDSFINCIENLIVLAGIEEEAAIEIRKLSLKIFDAFEIDNSGSVDFVEIANAFLVLFPSSNSEEKISTAFSLCDYDSNGGITFDELVSYLKSTFTLLYVVSPDFARQMEIEVQDLATATATQFFNDAGLEPDGEMEMKVFQKFVVSNLMIV